MTQYRLLGLQPPTMSLKPGPALGEVLLGLKGQQLTECFFLRTFFGAVEAPRLMDWASMASSLGMPLLGIWEAPVAVAPPAFLLRLDPTFQGCQGPAVGSGDLSV